MQKGIEYFNLKVIELIVMVSEIMEEDYLEVFTAIAKVLNLPSSQQEDIKKVLTDDLIQSNTTTFFKNVDEKKLSAEINCSLTIARTLIFQSHAIELVSKLNEKAYGKGPMFGFNYNMAKEEGLLIEYAMILFINGANMSKISNIVQEVLRINDFGNFEIATMISFYFDKNKSNVLAQVEKSNCHCKNYLINILKENTHSAKEGKDEL